MFAKHKHVHDWSGSGNLTDIKYYIPAVIFLALSFYSIEKFAWIGKPVLVS